MSSTTATTLDGLTTGVWNLDPAHSEFGFQVRHLMVSKVKGKFDEFTATLEAEERRRQLEAQAAA